MTDPRREPFTDPSNRRAHYRVEYPAKDRPAFTAGALTGDVTDCSETGVRVLLTAGLPEEMTVLVGDRMAATIRFFKGEIENIEGTIVRFDGKTLAMRLDAARIPYRRIVREQRWLRLRYPWRDSR